MKFDSAGMCVYISPIAFGRADNASRTRRRDTKAFYPTSERAVFEVLGLEWIDPTLRNADL